MYFLNKSKVVPLDDTHKPIHHQLKMIDNFLMNLQSSDPIVLNIKNIEKRNNVLHVKLAAIALFW